MGSSKVRWLPNESG